MTRTRTAALVLALSVAARLAWTWCPTVPTFVDLHVYLGGAAALDHPGTLYSYVYADQTPTSRCPSPTPVRGAGVLPLTRLPFAVVALGWQLGIIAALYGVVRVSQRLIGVSSQSAAMLWTAVGI